MAKTAKIEDVKRSESVTPTSTARPLLVTNRPTLTTDPMMAPPETERQEEMLSNDASHTAKSIEPPETAPTKVTVSDEESARASVEVDTKAGQVEASDSTATDMTPSTVSNTNVTDHSTMSMDESEAPRDSEAAITAEEAAVAEAKAKREQEIEDIITSGKYAVPVNVIQRRRSRMYTISLCVLAVVLAAILADIVADVDLVKVPSSVPHTHFFSK
jgi:hypothetical protein